MPNHSSIPPSSKILSGNDASGVRRVSVLPVRDTVLFPHAVLPLTVGRESSIQLIESLGEERAIVVVAQLDPRLDSPQPADMHAVGTLATVHKVVRMPNQSRFVFTEGTERVRLVRYTQTEPFMVAEVETLEDTAPAATASVEALVRNVIGQFQQIVAESPTLSDELRTIAANIEEPSRLVDFVASSLPFLTTDDKQQLLETPSIGTRLELLNQHLAKEIEDSMWYCESESLGILAFGQSREEAIYSFLQDFSALWDGVAQIPDESLTADALDVKRAFLRIVKDVQRV